ncbi:MAG: hypothetical protein RL698_410 [Pseudomonadota bacterium]|jgi:hypothetical protein
MQTRRIDPRLPAGAFLVALAFSACHGAGTVAVGPATPEAVVGDYLVALQSGAYATAYDLLTPNMTAEKGKIAWVTEQAALMRIAEVKIESFEVFPARPQGDKVIVPNLLKSTDKFINKGGANEYELYTLIRADDGRWRIEQQQLVESDAVANWFPERVWEKR